jgi:hypothetical protein
MLLSCHVLRSNETMMLMMLRGAITAGVAAMISIGTIVDGQARIKCNDEYQVIRGHGEIATPYCEDEYLARVARRYGIRVSGSAIRHSPSRKEEVCRAIGHDPRIFQICHQYRREGCMGPCVTSIAGPNGDA